MVLINKGDVVALGNGGRNAHQHTSRVRQFLDRIAEPAVSQELDYLQMLTEDRHGNRR